MGKPVGLKGKGTPGVGYRFLAQYPGVYPCHCLIAAALSTRFRISVTDIRKLLKDSTIQEWGKVRRVDSEEGDTIQSFLLGRKASDARDATFV